MNESQYAEINKLERMAHNAMHEAEELRDALRRIALTQHIGLEDGSCPACMADDALGLTQPTSEEE